MKAGAGMSTDEKISVPVATFGVSEVSTISNNSFSTETSKTSTEMNAGFLLNSNNYTRLRVASLLKNIRECVFG